MDDQIIKDITAQINPYAIGAQGYEEAIIRDIETAAECTGTKVIIIDNLTYLCNSADKGVDVIGKGTLDLQDRGCDAKLLVPEDDDISLKERCRRVNSWCLLYGKQNAILVSIHVIAYGNGSQWTQPHG